MDAISSSQLFRYEALANKTIQLEEVFAVIGYLRKKLEYVSEKLELQFHPADCAWECAEYVVSCGK